MDHIGDIDVRKGPGLTLPGAAVVVTGAGSGIGRALAHQLAAAGARVVVNDLDEASAAATAQAVGGVAAAGDMTDPDAVRALVQLCWDEFGALDLFCANAGESVPGSVATDGASWQAAWEANVMSQVYAARYLLPGWLEQGRGRLLSTVSAAGMLTVPGMAPYVVSKHAAFALAEWLRATHAHEGIVVQVLCPMGVRTPMLDRVDPLCSPMLEESAIEPELVARVAVEALAGDRFLILPHPEVAEWYAARGSATDEWLASMNGLHQQLAGLGRAA